MSYKMCQIREGQDHRYPKHIAIGGVKLGDVIKVGGATWNKCVVSDIQHQKETYPYVTVWRPHMNLVSITGKNEQPSVQFEIFHMSGGGNVTVVDNVGTTYTVGED